MSFGFDQIQALQSMLQESSNQSESHDNETTSSQQQQTNIPSSSKIIIKDQHQVIESSSLSGNTPSSSSTSTAHNNSQQHDVNDSKDICQPHEIPTEDELLELSNDQRISPKYTFYFKNNIGTEDMFLNNDHSQASRDSTHVVAKIHFPGSRMSDISLDVRPTMLRASSATHRLFTPLPRTVNIDKGSAKFDTKKELLIVALPIVLSDHDF